MEKISLKVYKDGMAGLLQLIKPPTHYSTLTALNDLSLEELILVEWRGRITNQQITTWRFRTNQKPYTLNLPLSVAVAMWQTLQRLPLSDALQELLNELTRTLVNSGLQPQYLPYHTYD
ncbi:MULTISPECIES: hypothetical protein [unclassified Spirosoma]|uniref:hypothetical protein n=1 Tax=unclassified Spirosoma TaxID=2621999 RepID=UPI00096281CA|nr:MULTISPECIES: hypothetical protein [unclassified Spirosoma]MBN8820781.1 hypothetical protein [Spirosoma sp.]OJW76374.1 MAG: hypothetical protein BGO59_22910 [Spirosoma sp. 48-14]